MIMKNKKLIIYIICAVAVVAIAAVAIAIALKHNTPSSTLSDGVGSSAYTTTNSEELKSENSTEKENNSSVPTGIDKIDMNVDDDDNIPTVDLDDIDSNTTTSSKGNGTSSESGSKDTTSSNTSSGSKDDSSQGQESGTSSTESSAQTAENTTMDGWSQWK